MICFYVRVEIVSTRSKVSGQCPDVLTPDMDMYLNVRHSGRQTAKKNKTGQLSFGDC